MFLSCSRAGVVKEALRSSYSVKSFIVGEQGVSAFVLAEINDFGSFPPFVFYARAILCSSLFCFGFCCRRRIVLVLLSRGQELVIVPNLKKQLFKVNDDDDSKSNDVDDVKN